MSRCLTDALGEVAVRTANGQPAITSPAPVRTLWYDYGVDLDGTLIVFYDPNHRQFPNRAPVVPDSVIEASCR